MSKFCRVHYATGEKKTVVFLDPVFRLALLKGTAEKIMVQGLVHVEANKRHVLKVEREAFNQIKAAAAAAHLVVVNSYLSISGGYFDLIVEFEMA